MWPIVLRPIDVLPLREWKPRTERCRKIPCPMPGCDASWTGFNALNIAPHSRMLHRWCPECCRWISEIGFVRHGCVQEAKKMGRVRFAERDWVL